MQCDYEKLKEWLRDYVNCMIPAAYDWCEALDDCFPTDEPTDAGFDRVAKLAKPPADESPVMAISPELHEKATDKRPECKVAGCDHVSEGLDDEGHPMCFEHIKFFQEQGERDKAWQAYVRKLEVNSPDADRISFDAGFDAGRAAGHESYEKVIGHAEREIDKLRDEVERLQSKRHTIINELTSMY
tara:strand:+ start:2159 stop:2716 length:558 start_codon:yes stop_codon:yes gene_type:complete